MTRDPCSSSSLRSRCHQNLGAQARKFSWQPIMHIAGHSCMHVGLSIDPIHLSYPPVSRWQRVSQHVSTMLPLQDAPPGAQMLDLVKASTKQLSKAERLVAGCSGALELSTLLLWLSLIYFCNHSHMVNLLRKDKNHSNEMVVAHQRSLVRPLIWYGCHLLRRFFTVCTLWCIPRYPGYISRLHLWLLRDNRVSMPLLALLLFPPSLFFFDR